MVTQSGSSRKLTLSVNRLNIKPVEKDMTDKLNPASLLLTLLAVSITLPALAQPSKGAITEFDAPGAGTVSLPACAPFCGTAAFAINTEGAIAGSYTDTNIVPHGFLRSVDGHITSFDAPGAGLGHGLNQGTVAFSVNDLGVIAGQFEDSSYVFHGFVRYADGSFSTFDAPGAGTRANQGTLALSLNSAGVAAGSYVDGSNLQHGFVRSSNGAITTFDAPGAIATTPCKATCINANGAIVGYYVDANGVLYGFLRQPGGTMVAIDAPGAGAAAGQGTIAESIDLNGGIAGYFVDSKLAIHGFLRTPDGQFSKVDVPAAGHGAEQGTAPLSLSLSGIAGDFLDSKGVMHGFSRSNAGFVVIFDAPGAGAAAGQGTRPSKCNQGGSVTGWFVDSNNLNYGFLWQPSVIP
jgi:hypothetical protein